jgi:hypothetical protein
MKEFFKGLVVLIGASFVSVLILWFLFIYSLGYSIWKTITLRDWKAFFIFWFRLIDGIFACIGHILFNIGYALDMMWNVNGEAIEDSITHKENTEFGKKNITVSASVGKLEIDGKLNKFGRILSKILNFVFQQRQHAKDSWYMKLAKDELEEKYFKK